MRGLAILALILLGVGQASYSFADGRYGAAVIFVPEITVSDAKRCQNVFLKSKKHAARNLKIEALGGESLEAYLRETEEFWAAVSLRAGNASHKTNLYSAGTLIEAPGNYDYSWFNSDMSDDFIASECGKISGFARRAVSLKPQTAMLSSEESRKSDKEELARLSYVPLGRVLDCSTVSLVEFQKSLSLKGLSPDASSERLAKAKSWMLVLEDKMNDGKVAASSGGESVLWDSLTTLGVESAKSVSHWKQTSESCFNDHH